MEDPHSQRHADEPQTIGGFSLVTLLHIAQLAALLSALIYWLATNNTRSTNTEQRLTDLQTTVTTQVTELRNQIVASASDVRTQIANLPDIRARMDSYERRMTDHERTMTSLDARLATLERALIQMQADYNALQRASAAPLKDGRR